MPRPVARFLQSFGLRAEARLTRRTLHDQATDRFRVLWDSLSGRHCVVWVDNLFRRRFVSNPDVAHQSRSMSVVAVLHVPRLPMCPPLPTVDYLHRQRSVVSRDLVVASRQLLSAVTDIAESDVPRSEVRVPLDVHRGQVRSLQWMPFMLTTLSVGKQDELVGLLEFLRQDLLTQCRSPMPVLVDLNLHYRHLKMSYGGWYRRWNYHAHFRYMPVLFGVWHSYKHCCEVVFRRFHSQYIYLQKGTVEADSKHPTKPRLISLEYLFAAVLQAPLGVRRALRDRVDHRRGRVTDIRARRDRARAREPGEYSTPLERDVQPRQ
jgi:hypothetical protein